MDITPVRVLAVEDNPADLRLLIEELKEATEMRFEVVGAGTVREAVGLLASGSFAVVLLDLNLPDGHGLEVLDRIRAANPTPVVIVLTGTDDRETGLQALAHDAQDYLVKGKINSDVLVRCIRYALLRDEAEKQMRELNVELEKRVAELRTANEDLRVARMAAFNMMEDALSARAEAEKEKSTLEAVMEALPVGVVITDTHGGQVKSNRTYEEIWGEPRTPPRSTEEYGSRQAWWTESGDPVTAEEWASSQVLQKGAPVTDQMIEIQRGDGSHAYVINSAAPVRDTKGIIIGSAVSIQDVTELRRIEQALRKARDELELRVKERTEELEYANRSLVGEVAERREIEKQLRVQITAMEAAANGILITDRQGIIQWTNPALAQMTGYSLEEMLGRNPSLLRSGRQKPKFYRDLWRTILEGQVWHGEIVNRNKDGSLYVEDQTITPVKSEDGQISHFIAVKQDITERKQAEQELAKRNEELLEVTRVEHKQRQLAEALVQSSIALNASLDLDKVLAEILKQVQKAIPCRGVLILLVEGERVDIVRTIGIEATTEELGQLGSGFPLDAFEPLDRIRKSGRSFLSGDLQEEPNWMTLPGLEWIRSLILTPIIVHRQLLGFAGVLSEKPDHFNEENVTELKAFTHYAVTAIQNARLYAAERSARHTAETLGKASHALTQTLSLESVLNTLLDYLGELVPFGGARISLLEGTDSLTVRTWRGDKRLVKPEKGKGHSIQVESNAVIDAVFNTRKSLLIPDSHKHPGWETYPANSPARNWLGLPILTGEDIIGLVELVDSQPDTFTPEHVRWGEALVKQGAVAIQNAWLFEQLRAGRERLQLLSRRLFEIQESERRYIARELHDQAGQSLTSLLLALGELEKEAEKPDSVRSRVAGLKKLTDEIYEELHRLSMRLRPAGLEHLGLAAILDQLVTTFNGHTQTQLKFKAVGIRENEHLPAEIEINMYRIVQEALTNIRRHARASMVDVLLERREDKLILMVEDNGAGFNPELAGNGEHLGLLGIRERAETLGGSLIIESSPNHGTTLVVEVPYNGNTNPAGG